MANLGPNAGQRNHFRNYAPSFILDSRQTAYGAIRYTNEVNRIYGVLDKQLQGKAYITGEYSIADMICWPWIQGRSDAALQMEEFPDLAAWKARIGEREPVKAALARAADVRGGVGLQQSSREAEEARKVLFGQRARALTPQIPGFTASKSDECWCGDLARSAIFRLNYIFSEDRLSLIAWGCASVVRTARRRSWREAMTMLGVEGMGAESVLPLP